MGQVTYPITPVTKPRQTRSDKWKRRPCVLRYRAFADMCRLYRVELPERGASIVFVLPMPTSWSKRKRAEMDGQPHRQTPDLDNLVKALSDAVHADDSGIWHYSDIRKVWGITGKIIISNQTKTL